MLWEGGCLAEGPVSWKTWLVFIFSPLKLLFTTILFFGVMSVAVKFLFLPRSRNETKYVSSGASSAVSFMLFFTIGSGKKLLCNSSNTSRCYKHHSNGLNCFLPKVSSTFAANSEMLSINFSIVGSPSSARQNP